jgi:hypothetical protein
MNQTVVMLRDDLKACMDNLQVIQDHKHVIDADMSVLLGQCTYWSVQCLNGHCLSRT